MEMGAKPAQLGESSRTRSPIPELKPSMSMLNSRMHFSKPSARFTMDVQDRRAPPHLRRTPRSLLGAATPRHFSPLPPHLSLLGTTVSHLHNRRRTTTKTLPHPGYGVIIQHLVVLIGVPLIIVPGPSPHDHHQRIILTFLSLHSRTHTTAPGNVFSMLVCTPPLHVITTFFAESLRMAPSG